jgi:hypothetical protein
MIISPAGTVPVTQTQIAAGNVVVRANSGMLCTVIVTTVTAVASLTVFDNATTAAGTVIAIIPSGTAAGTIFQYNIPVVNGITIGQQAAFTGGITVVVG